MVLLVNMEDFIHAMTAIILENWSITSGKTVLQLIRAHGALDEMPD